MIIIPAIFISVNIILDIMSVSEMNIRRQRTSVRRRQRTNSRRTSDFVGLKTLPSEMPPVVNTVPWNQATLILKKTASSTHFQCKISDLTTTAKSQLGFSNVEPVADTPKNIAFEFRLQSFSVWSEASISAYPIDLVRGTSDSKAQVELMRLDSFPMKNMFARVGFNFPAQVQALPLASIRDADQVITVFNILNKDFEIHYHVLWRGAYSAELKLKFDYVNSSTRNTKSAEQAELTDVLSRILRIESLLLPSVLPEQPDSLSGSISDMGADGCLETLDCNSKG